MAAVQPTLTSRVCSPYPVTVRHPRSASYAAAVLALWLCAACTSTGDAPQAAAHPPHLPEGEAGQVLSRAIDAAGGWARWRAIRDVTYVSMLTIVDPVRQVSSDSIGWFSAPLHDGKRARMDSLGLPTEVRFGIDADDTWIVSDGRPVTAPGQLALTHFDMVSSLFWFSLPFSLAEPPASVTYAGAQSSDEGKQWQRLQVEFPDDTPGMPGTWFVVYFDTETGLIDHIHGRLTAPFLRHELWVGRWLHYRDCDGIMKERQRQFFPADPDGTIVGDMVAEQFIERVRFNSGYAADYFDKPHTVEQPTPVEDNPDDGKAGMRAAALAGADRLAAR